MKIAPALLGCVLAATVAARAQAPAQTEAKAPAQPFESQIRAFERADAKKAPPKGAVLFIGSSSIVKWTSLARDLPDFPVINRGFGGSVIAQSTLYAPRIVWPYEPRVVVFYAGDNDLGAGRSPKQVLADFQEFATATRGKLPGTSIAFIAIKPSPARAGIRAKAVRANALIREWIEGRREQQMRFIDVWTPMTDDRGNARGELFGPDRLHMNEKGYVLWTQVIAPQLHAILGPPVPTANGVADNAAAPTTETQAPQVAPAP